MIPLAIQCWWLSLYKVDALHRTRLAYSTNNTRSGGQNNQCDEPEHTGEEEYEKVTEARISTIHGQQPYPTGDIIIEKEAQDPCGDYKNEPIEEPEEEEGGIGARVRHENIDQPYRNKDDIVDTGVLPPYRW